MCFKSPYFLDVDVNIIPILDELDGKLVLSVFF